MMSLFSTTARCICCNISNRTLHKVRLLSTPTALENSFHKRVLPSSLIALNSTEGKKVFIEALEEGNMESYFPLAEQFMTQSEPAYCAVTSLAMVMNALNHDPQRVWKGVWRWVSDEMLQCETKGECGHSLEKVKKEGMNFRSV
jgi:glutathione gamma-glutamylcysteinyltransferase